MNLTKRAVYKYLEALPVVGPVARRIREPLERVSYYAIRHSLRRHYRERSSIVKQCEDNAFIPRVETAGRVVDGYMIMHNGIKVCANGYYGTGMRELLIENRGCHEPQEERVFQEVLKWLPQRATMLELGAAWGFYSLWFHKSVAAPRCILVEPDKMNLDYGKANFSANKMVADFEWAAIGDKESIADGLKTTTVDTLAHEKGIERIHILHSDIQGYELAMLQGAKKSFDDGKIDFVFISTHTPELHNACRSFLLGRKFIILADVDLDNTYSWDGVIVAVRPGVPAPQPISISRRCA